MTQPSRKRGRPRILDRSAGLETAARLFWERGYEGTSIAELTKAMGVTPPSLYATFGSKEELYKQALDRNIEHQSKRRSEALRSEMSAYDALAFYLYDVAEGITDPDKPRGCIVSTAVLQHAEDSQSVARHVAKLRETSIQCLKTRFDRAVNEGELAGDTDTDALARFYSAVVQGMSAQACDGACTARLKTLADIALTAWPGNHAPTKS
ncbi:TetR/AcrR family transcriptional regulator [Mesorhizobium sp. VK25A]|uniref:TetR/AcrR family transcriptional regulator n=1 Tax=Mesorhizobium vachelliae TaxID=3072309 RepID=A0ABU5A0L4_9HYPH|nr:MULTISPECIES: TetR/AcrR family transcriptional regulator [unclassified Mesorhizobium]MDX8530815.1 TetR/AcrR family transcriptional regulator [Mesorhizobium sp. VK25D]MDX8543434.1 TetR/AcrR family transcriptional regulator [Mesorhizobium sp. VK25A]